MKRVILLLLMSVALVSGADQLWYQPPDPVDTGVARSFFYEDQYWSESADNFMIGSTGEIISVEWWGHDSNAPGQALADHFMIRIYEDVVPPGAESQPGELLREEMHLSWSEEWDEAVGHNRYMADLHDSFVYLTGAKYWISIQAVAAEPPMSGWGLGYTSLDFGWDGFYANDRLHGWVIYQKDLAFALHGELSTATSSSDWTTLKTLY